LVLWIVWFALRSLQIDTYDKIKRKKKQLFAVYGQFKNEGHVLNEWIDHYLQEGADHIFMVDNGSDDHYQIEERFLSRISVFVRETRHSQIQNGRDILSIIRRDYEWVLVVDLDEFAYTRHYPSLRDFLLKTSRDTVCVCVPWKMFGSGHHVRQPESVIDGFLWRDDTDTTFPEGRLVKSLFRTDHADFGIHVPRFRDSRHKRYPHTWMIGDPGHAISITDGRIPTDVEIRQGEIALNHYAIQSQDFFRNVKMRRGSASTSQYDHVRNHAYFEKYDKNVVFDNELSRKRHEKKKPHLVMTRYRESLDFLDSNPGLFDHFDEIHVYNKGLPDIMMYRKDVRIHECVNLGDAEEGFLRFILDHYEKEDMTVLFTSASLFCYPNQSKEKKFLFTLDRVLITGDSVVCVGPVNDKERRRHMSWTLDEYRQAGLENRIVTRARLTPCVYRPFGHWLSTVVGIGEEEFRFVSYHGIFAVSSEDWRSRTKEFYEEIHKRLMWEHPEENHYLERAWAYLFRLADEKMLFYDEHRLKLDIPNIQRWCEYSLRQFSGSE